MTRFLEERARVAAALYGVAPASGANIVVAVDEPSLLSVFTSASSDDVVIVMVASTTAAHLAEVASRVGGATPNDDAYAQALRWASSFASHAPATSAARIREIAGLAGAAGRVLVEPELPPYLRSVRPAKTALDRAITAILLQGELAHPLIFVAERRAPKHGLAKLREEKLLDMQITLGAAASLATDEPLVDAAVTALRESPGSSLHGKELLREARARRTQAKASASDGPELARHLYLAWLRGEIDLSLA